MYRRVQQNQCHRSSQPLQAPHGKGHASQRHGKPLRQGPRIAMCGSFLPRTAVKIFAVSSGKPRERLRGG
jgi:hypothetical protein